MALGSRAAKRADIASASPRSGSRRCQKANKRIAEARMDLAVAPHWMDSEREAMAALGKKLAVRYSAISNLYGRSTALLDDIRLARQHHRAASRLRRIERSAANFGDRRRACHMERSRARCRMELQDVSL